MRKAMIETETVYDFSNVPDEALNEFHRQAELWLEGTIKIAIAADGRATTSTGILSAATGALVVLAANLASSAAPNRALLAAVIVAALCLLIAAGFCATAARPIDFYVSGYEPKNLHPAAATEQHIKRVSAADIQFRIDSNKRALAQAAKALRRGQIIAAASAPIFIIIYCLLAP
jgi:hypothetical protein